jgi:hypothetical protein
MSDTIIKERAANPKAVKWVDVSPCNNAPGSVKPVVGADV